MYLNYHHLHYFWAVAKDGQLTRAAQRLNVSQSALSSQIKQLEEQLGQELFVRKGRTLVLTEAGSIALAYADEIFAAGGELLATLKDGRHRDQVLRVGAVATLSRNFQELFVKPLLSDAGVRLRLSSGTLHELLGLLAEHELDVILSNRPVQHEVGHEFRCRRIAQQKVSLVGRPRARPFRFPQDVASVSLVLPSPRSEIRTAFDTLCDKHDLVPQVLAEVDDMAMLRLLARDTDSVALLPSVVVRDELQSGRLQEYCVVPGLFETFYAITVLRQYPHPLLKPLLARSEDEILAMGRTGPPLKPSRKPTKRSSLPPRRG